MPELHAKLGPSSAERWMNCPGSVVLCEGIPGKTSAHAEEGTRAHELAEAMLKQRAYSANPDMLLHVSVYTSHICELHTQSEGNMLFIEHRVKVTDDLWGTADAIIWEPTTATLYVRDLKYGSGVAVEVSNNLQLKLYALAALLTMKLPARTVNVGIVQPRLNHPDGPIRSKDFDAVDLIDFHAEVMEAVQRVKNAHGDGLSFFPNGDKVWEQTFLKPTEKGCRWCLAAPTCPALKAKTKELVKQAFTPATPYKPEELAEALDYAPILEGWIKNLREFAYAEAEKGNPIPGYKLVEKRATRKWKDEKQTAFYLMEDFQLEEHEVFEQKLLTPAAIEKLLPKDKKDLLDALCTKESSGHTLVHHSDKRPAIRVDAKAAFTE